jgi:hypothetical protein
VAQSAGGFTQEDFTLDTGSTEDPSSATPAADISLDDYFDRLDAAFANLSGAPAGQLKGAVAAGDDTSWAPPSSGAWSAADPASLAAQATAAAAGDGSTGSVAVAQPPAGSAGVPVADAFAALLEAEQQGGALPPAPVGEVTMATVSFGAAAVTDALVDEVVERVVQRLGGQSIQDTIARIVSETAERLVREEIERLKAASSR